MRHTLLRSALVLALLGPGAMLAFAQAPSIDWVALVGDYPRTGSETQVGDTAIMLWLQRTRTGDDVLRAQREASHPLALFSPAAGVDLEGPRMALTRALVEGATTHLLQVLSPVKAHYARPRPYAEDPRITPAVPMEPTFAYPSGHASWGMVVAGVLAELAPSRREALLARGRLVGYDRVLGGVHHPSDVLAGQLLGETLVALWLKDPATQKALTSARAAEW